MGLDTTPLTAADSLPANLYPPKSGSAVLAADVAAGLLVAWDYVQSLAYGYLALGKTIVIGQPWILDPSTAGTIALSGTGFSKNEVPTGSSAQMVPKFLHGMKVRTITVKVFPAVHGSIVGLTFPVLVFAKYDLSGTLAHLWTVSDTSANWISNNAAGYSTAHDMTLDLGADERLDLTAYTYTVGYQQEVGGAFAATGDVGQPRIPFKQFAP